MNIERLTIRDRVMIANILACEAAELRLLAPKCNDKGETVLTDRADRLETLSERIAPEPVTAPRDYRPMGHVPYDPIAADFARIDSE